MEGLDNYSITAEWRIIGYSLVQWLYVLLDRICPLASQLYRQEDFCASEDVAFQSKIKQTKTLINTFEPVAGTVMLILLDCWYCAKRFW